jgi:hypothetical protein
MSVERSEMKSKVRKVGLVRRTHWRERGASLLFLELLQKLLRNRPPLREIVQFGGVRFAVVGMIGILDQKMQMTDYCRSEEELTSFDLAEAVRNE